MPGFPCSQLQQTLSHSQGQGKCLAALVHRWNVRLSNSEVRENVWVHLSVRSGEMPGCTVRRVRGMVPRCCHLEEKAGQWLNSACCSVGGQRPGVGRKVTGLDKLIH